MRLLITSMRSKGKVISLLLVAQRGDHHHQRQSGADAVSIIKSLLEGEQNAKERAVAWLELQGVKL